MEWVRLEGQNENICSVLKNFLSLQRRNISVHLPLKGEYNFFLLYFGFYPLFLFLFTQCLGVVRLSSGLGGWLSPIMAQSSVL